jgi:hypothetical protein
MKKALAGPAKRTAKKLPERRAMIAAARRRAMVARVRAEACTRAADRRLNALLLAAPRVEVWTRAADRRLDRLLVRAWPRLAAAGRRVGAVCRPWVQWLSRRLRPAAVLLLRAFSLAERLLRRLSAATTQAATRASAVITPERAICGAIVACAACLVVSQFVAYRGVEIGQPGYAGLPQSAAPPTVGVETAGEAHSYLLVPVALLAASLAAFAALAPRRRGLGRAIVVLGLLSIAVVLLVDRPAGLDESAQASRFSGAIAVLDDGFYAELASAAGLVLGGLLLVAAPKAAARYHARRCRTRTSSFARVASALRRRRRRRASSRGRDARRPSPRRNGAASAPASRP